MKYQLLRTASVCALVAAMGGAAFAQSGGPGAQGGGAPQTQQEKRPETGGETGRQGGGVAGETVRPKDGAAQRPAERQKGAEEQKQERPKQDRQRTGQEQRGQDQDRARTGQDQRGEDKGRARTGQEQGGQEKDRKRQVQADRDRGGATQLSEQQRTSVRERFTRSGVERNRVANVNFEVRVGASVPRNVTMHVLPPDIVEVVPAYRGYRYVYVRDEIIIVNPATYAVVAVITNGGSRTAATRERRSVTLAPADRVFVREHIDRGASIRLGIGNIRIGMMAPQGIELLPLPSVVVERVPDFREYRYFVYEDEIAIVDPATDEIVYIVEQ